MKKIFLFVALLMTFLISCTTDNVVKSTTSSNDFTVSYDESNNNTSIFQGNSITSDIAKNFIISYIDSNGNNISISPTPDMISLNTSNVGDFEATITFNGISKKITVPVYTDPRKLDFSIDEEVGAIDSEIKNGDFIYIPKFSPNHVAITHIMECGFDLYSSGANVPNKFSAKWATSVDILAFGEIEKVEIPLVNAIPSGKIFTNKTKYADFSSLENIQNFAEPFRDLENLNTIILKKIKTIGEEAFINDTNLSNITLGNICPSIGDNAFQGVLSTLTFHVPLNSKDTYTKYLNDNQSRIGLNNYTIKTY